MKVLVLRLSSFGDIVQCMSILEPLKKSNENLMVHWVSRSDFTPIVKLSPLVNKVWSFDRSLGLKGLISLGLELKKEGYTHIYDAHSTIRSRILCFILSLSLFNNVKFKRRSKERIKRIFLFKFRKNYFSRPFIGMKSYLEPISSWISGYDKELKQTWDFTDVKIKVEIPEKYIVLAPSAAWAMKTWPESHFKELISLLPQYKFIILGGPADKFCQEFEDNGPMNVKNMAGKLLLTESCLMIKNADLVISADTGLIHVADLLGVNGVSLLGPTAFGRCYGKHIKTFEVELNCRPCTKDGRGKCQMPVWQQCMVDITPVSVANYVKEIL